MADLIIRNALLLDGTGASAIEADVAITADRISAVGSVAEGAVSEIDAEGKVVAPGFVDVHTHDDGALLRHPGMEFKLSQGCTSLVVGNCGFSAVPAEAGEREKSNREKPGKVRRAWLASRTWEAVMVVSEFISFGGVGVRGLRRFFRRCRRAGVCRGL